MNPIHFHLIINHFPIILPIIGFSVLSGGFIFKSEIVKRTGLFIIVLGALLTIPAFISGDNSEHFLDDQLAEKSAIAIDQHEDYAEIFAKLSYAVGALSLFGFWANLKKKSFSNWVNGVVLLVTIMLIFMATKVGTSGGEIRHPEMYSLPPSQRSE